MLFSKIQMLELKTSGMYVQMASIVHIFQASICLRLTATHGLKFSALESENIRATVLLTLSFHG